MSDEDEKEKVPKRDLYVVLDTSVLFAYVYEKDTHHVSVASALGAIKPYKPSICISSVVLMEVMGKLTKRCGYTVAYALKILEGKLKGFDIRHEKVNLSKEYILNRYKRFAKSKIHSLTGIDFYIVVDAIVVDGILLTCDKGMHEKAKTRHKKTILLSSGKSELPKLIKLIEKGP